VFGTVIAGLDPAIHASAVSTRFDVTAWMPGSSPGMTKRRKKEERKEGEKERRRSVY
jgi:hypothetical protein